MGIKEFYIQNSKDMSKQYESIVCVILMILRGDTEDSTETLCALFCS